MADAKTDEIRNFVVGPIQTNCYAYVSGGACMVVDPGAAGAAVAEHLADVRVECVVATHGHGGRHGGSLLHQRRRRGARHARGRALRTGHCL